MVDGRTPMIQRWREKSTVFPPDQRADRAEHKWLGHGGYLVRETCSTPYSTRKAVQPLGAPQFYGCLIVSYCYTVEDAA